MGYLYHRSNALMITSHRESASKLAFPLNHKRKYLRCFLLLRSLHRTRVSHIATRSATRVRFRVGITKINNSSEDGLFILVISPGIEPGLPG